MDSVKAEPRVTNRLVFGLGIIAVLALLYFFAPDKYAFYPRCLFHSFTGLDCPGCGVLRATHQLLHGNIAAAFDLNPLFILILPFGGIFLGYRMSQATSRKSTDCLASKTWIGIGLVCIIAFTLFRNLP